MKYTGQSGGSSKRASGREAVAGSEFDPQRSRTTEASPGHKHLNQQRGPVESSSDPKQTGRNTKNYEAALKGIEGLQFESDERNQY